MAAITISTRAFVPWRRAWRSTIPPAFDAYARDVLRANIADLIPVSDEESEHFACNAVVLGETVVTNTGCPALHRQLRARGFQTGRVSVERIRQGRRQRQVSDAPAGRRRRGGVEDGKRPMNQLGQPLPGFCRRRMAIGCQIKNIGNSREPTAPGAG